MIRINSKTLALMLRIYVIGALGVSALLTPLPLTLAPCVLIVLHLGLIWRSPLKFALIINSFTFYAIALMIIPLVGPYVACLPPLPVLLLINKSLRQTAELNVRSYTLHRIYPTRTLVVLAKTNLGVFALGMILNNIAVIITCSVLVIYIGILALLAFKNISVQPIVTDQSLLRIIAGSRIDRTIKIKCDINGGMLFLESLYPGITLERTRIPLTIGEMSIKVTIMAALSGPHSIKFLACVTDHLGLIQNTFYLQPISLHIIPRAKYAAWFANKYIRETKPGMLPLTSNVNSLKSPLGPKTGVEYYGSRPHQPGDSLRSVDWRHSVRYQQLVTKEFHELLGRPTALLVDMGAKDAEEVDKLAHKIVTTSFSLAYEGITAVIAAYDRNAVKLVTGILDPKAMVSESIRLVKDIATEKTLSRFLAYADIGIIKADIRRLSSKNSPQTRALGQLLAYEHSNLVKNSAVHPASQALWRALGRLGVQSNVVSISGSGGNTQALAIQLSTLASRGNAIIIV